MEATAEPGLWAFRNDAGRDVFVHGWLPDQAARAVVLVAHGMADPDGRHEMLNETNRDEVVHDVLAWLDERVAATAA